VLKDNLLRLVPAIRGAVRQAEDARARDLAEQMLRRSESRLQAIIDTSGDWIWECDRDGRFTFSSPSISEILGYRHHEVLAGARRTTSTRRRVAPADELAELENGGDVGATSHCAGVTRAARLVGSNARPSHCATKRRVPRHARQRSRRHGAHGAGGPDPPAQPRAALLSGASSAVIRLRDRQQLLRPAGSRDRARRRRQDSFKSCCSIAEPDHRRARAAQEAQRAVEPADPDLCAMRTVTSRSLAAHAAEHAVVVAQQCDGLAFEPTSLPLL